MNATGMVMLYVLAWIGMGAIGLWLARFVDAVCDSGDEDSLGFLESFLAGPIVFAVSITLAIACVVCVVRDATNKNRQAQEKL